MTELHPTSGPQSMTEPFPKTRRVAAGADVFLVKAGNLAPRLLSAIQEFFPDDLDENDAEPKHFYERFTTVE